MLETLLINLNITKLIKVKVLVNFEPISEMGAKLEEKEYS